METSIPLPFIPSLKFERDTSTRGSVTRTQLSYFGCVYLTANNRNIDTLFQTLQDYTDVEVYVDVTEIKSADDIVSILDAGARKVFATVSQLEDLKLYPDRALPALSEQDEAPSDNVLSNGALVNVGKVELASNSLVQDLKARNVSPLFLLVEATGATYVTKLATEYAATPIIPSTLLTLDKAEEGRVYVPGVIGASWSSDRPDGLVPTVVTDERGIALGLVYSNEESLAESLKTGTGVYQSRKRGLWYKGATSGDTQELVRISLDCDQDCLKFVVRQKGRGMLI